MLLDIQLMNNFNPLSKLCSDTPMKLSVSLSPCWIKLIFNFGQLVCVCVCVIKQIVGNKAAS